MGKKFFKWLLWQHIRLHENRQCARHNLVDTANRIYTATGERTKLADVHDNDVATLPLLLLYIVIYSRQLFVTIASYFVAENGVLRRRMGLSNNEVSISIFAHFLRRDTIILCVIKIMPNPCGYFVFIQFAQILVFSQQFILYLALIFFSSSSPSCSFHAENRLKKAA